MKTWCCHRQRFQYGRFRSVSGTPPHQVIGAHTESAVVAGIKSASSGQAHGESTANNLLFQQRCGGKPRFGEKPENVTAPDP